MAKASRCDAALARKKEKVSAAAAVAAEKKALELARQVETLREELQREQEKSATSGEMLRTEIAAALAEKRKAEARAECVNSYIMHSTISLTGLTHLDLFVHDDCHCDCASWQ